MRKMKEKDLNWNKSFLQDEYDYIIQLVKHRKEEVNKLTLENSYVGDTPIHNLSEHHDMMMSLRLMVGKGMEIYCNKNLPLTDKQKIKNVLSDIDKVFYRLEQEGYLLK